MVLLISLCINLGYMNMVCSILNTSMLIFKQNSYTYISMHTDVNERFVWINMYDVMQYVYIYPVLIVMNQWTNTKKLCFNSDDLFLFHEFDQDCGISQDCWILSNICVYMYTLLLLSCAMITLSLPTILFYKQCPCISQINISIKPCICIMSKLYLDI